MDRPACRAIQITCRERPNRAAARRSCAVERPEFRSEFREWRPDQLSLARERQRGGQRYRNRPTPLATDSAPLPANKIAPPPTHQTKHAPAPDIVLLRQKAGAACGP